MVMEPIHNGIILIMKLIANNTITDVIVLALTVLTIAFVASFFSIQ